MEARLNGITILWTPRKGQLGSLPPLICPEASDLGTILVHPIPDDTDSQIEGLPGEDITTDDCIVVFPADMDLKSMYVVFARPFGGDHDYYPPPKELAAFPDAKIVPRKTPIKRGGVCESDGGQRMGLSLSGIASTGQSKSTTSAENIWGSLIPKQVSGPKMRTIRARWNLEIHY